MLRTRRLLLGRSLCALLALSAGTAQPVQTKVRINGSTTVNPVVVEAAQILREEDGLEILVDTVGGSSGGIAALGHGRVEIGMMSRPLNERDRQRLPRVDFHTFEIGTDAIALVVSSDVWEGGVRQLTPMEVRDLYEGRIRNWQDLGGPDRRVVFFNKEPGRGTWGVFSRWLYGSPDSAPLVSLPGVGSNEEGRNKVASTPGSITQLSAAWADQLRVFALGLVNENGNVQYPTPENVASDSYPLARPLLLVTDGPPNGEALHLLEFLAERRGQQLVAGHGYVPISTSSPGSLSP